MSSYLETIGNTPLVRLERALPEEVRANGATILCKMEMQNPGGSIKDRIAKVLYPAGSSPQPYRGYSHLKDPPWPARPR